jgi:hypothetical protein
LTASASTSWVVGLKAYATVTQQQNIF